MSLRVEPLHEGAALRLVLDAPPGNVVDAALMAALREALEQALRGRTRPAPDVVRAAILEGAGDHFSYGASVPEHVKEKAPAMLRQLHRLIEQMLEAPFVTVAAIRGRCLGGGLELALACDVLVAAPGARLGLPEPKLGVFAPAGSVLLRDRLGARAAELLLTGRDVDAGEAHRIGLVDFVADDPGAAASEWVRTHLVARSALASSFAVRAARAARLLRFNSEIAAVERLYVDELLTTHDGNEGIAAFLEKRKPRWTEG